MMSRHSHRRRGFTLLVVLVFLAVGLILVSVNQRRIASLLRLERASMAADDFDEGPVQVMSKALEMLETGLPPSTPYACSTSISTSAGVLDFHVVYTEVTTGEWTVNVSPLDPTLSLPSMPATFAY